MTTWTQLPLLVFLTLQMIFLQVPLAGAQEQMVLTLRVKHMDTNQAVAVEFNSTTFRMFHNCLCSQKIKTCIVKYNVNFQVSSIVPTETGLLNYSKSYMCAYSLQSPTQPQLRCDRLEINDISSTILEEKQRISFGSTDQPCELGLVDIFWDPHFNQTFEVADLDENYVRLTYINVTKPDGNIISTARPNPTSVASENTSFEIVETTTNSWKESSRSSLFTQLQTSTSGSTSKKTPSTLMTSSPSVTENPGNVSAGTEIPEFTDITTLKLTTITTASQLSTSSTVDKKTTQTSNSTIGNNSKATTGSQVKIDTKSTTNPTVDYKTKPTTDPTVDSNSKPTTDPTVNTNSKPTTGPTVDTNSKSTTDPTVDSNSKPTTDPTVNTNSKPTDPTVDTNSKPTTGPTVDTNSKPTTGPTVDTNSKPTTGPTVDTNSKPTTGPTIDTNSKPSIDPTVNTNSKPTTDPTVDTNSKPTTDPTVDSNSKPTTDPIVDSNSKPTANPTVDTNSKPTIDPTVNTNSKPATDSAVDTKTKPPTASTIDTKTKQPTNFTIDTETKPNTTLPSITKTNPITTDTFSNYFSTSISKPAGLSTTKSSTSPKPPSSSATINTSVDPTDSSDHLTSITKLSSPNEKTSTITVPNRSISTTILADANAQESKSNENGSFDPSEDSDAIGMLVAAVVGTILLVLCTVLIVLICCPERATCHCKGRNNQFSPQRLDSIHSVGTSQDNDVSSHSWASTIELIYPEEEPAAKVFDYRHVDFKIPCSNTVTLENPTHTVYNNSSSNDNTTSDSFEDPGYSTLSQLRKSRAKRSLSNLSVRFKDTEVPVLFGDLNGVEHFRVDNCEYAIFKKKATTNPLYTDEDSKAKTQPSINDESPETHPWATDDNPESETWITNDKPETPSWVTDDKTEAQSWVTDDKPETQSLSSRDWPTTFENLDEKENEDNKSFMNEYIEIIDSPYQDIEIKTYL